MNDKQLAWLIISTTLLAILLLFCVMSLADMVVAIGRESDRCMVLAKQSDCRACCVAMGGSKGMCARECAKYKPVVSYSGMD